MISHKHKCIFVHIPKAAGTSIENVFMEELGINMDNRHALLLGANTNKNVGPRRVSHLLAKEYVKLHFISQELFDSYFKFAFVRNPYDRLYSTYKYRKFNEYISFDNFVKLKLRKLILSQSDGFFLKPQYEYLYDSKICLVDFIGKLENIENDFKKVLKILDLSHLELKHHNKSIFPKGINDKIKKFGRILKDVEAWPRLSFSNSDRLLSSTSKELIIKYYKRDFEIFNYEI